MEEKLVWCMYPLKLDQKTIDGLQSRRKAKEYLTRIKFKFNASPYFSDWELYPYRRNFSKKQRTKYFSDRSNSIQLYIWITYGIPGKIYTFSEKERYEDYELRTAIEDVEEEEKEKKGSFLSILWDVCTKRRKLNEEKHETY